MAWNRREPTCLLPAQAVRKSLRGTYSKAQFQYTHYAQSAAITRILRPTKPRALGLSCHSPGQSCAHLPVAREGAVQALEGAGEIREIVDADCVSDGLDQCSGLCTVPGNSTSMLVRVNLENRPRRTVLRPDRNNAFSSPAQNLGKASKAPGSVFGRPQHIQGINGDVHRELRVYPSRLWPLSRLL